MGFTLSTGQSQVVGGSGKALIAGLYQEGITISMYQDGTSPAKSFSVAAPDVLTSLAFVTP